MASKKYTLLAGILCLLASTGFTQGMSPGYDVRDSSVIPSSRMPQHNEFLNGTNNFPAKPRNQWELGIQVGTFNVRGDVPSRTFSPGFGLHLRKAIGYIFSLRGQFVYGVSKGLHFRQAYNYGKNTAWSTNGYAANTEPVYYNFRTNIQDLSLQAVASLANIRFHKSKARTNFYAFAGLGGMIYEVEVNALNGSGQRYNFASIPQGVYENREEVKDQIQDLLDDTYETPAQNHGERRGKLFGKTFRANGHFGAGMAIKLSDRINFAVEERYSIAKDDLLDGQQWQEHATGDAVLTPEFDSYNFFSLGLNFNLGSRSVEPLWWMNPLDYAYSEIRNPRLMRLPRPVLPDADNDGVTDQFDLEQTPAGCPVTTRGVSLDTDGDGVPDCRDKELVTPTYCQPVNTDGVGNCPCPDSSCFPAPTMVGGACATTLGALPSVTFSGSSVAISSDAASMLATVASRLRNNPECRIVVVGYCASNKQAQQRSWDRVNAVINHLVEREGISADRFIFNYGQEGGDCNTVDLRAADAGEEGPNTVPAPHPNLRRGN